MTHIICLLTSFFANLFSNVQSSKIVLLLFVIVSATGCTYQVNSYDDLPDNDPGDYSCDTGRGSCTLRAAIMEANATGVSDTILIPSGTYDLTLPIASGGGSLDIDNSVVLQGSGYNNTIINQTTSSRVIRITNGEVIINNLTVQGGDAQTGGGIHIDNSEVEITDVVIQNNFGFTGGGGLLVDDNGDVTIRRVSINNNSAQGAFGGGIWNQGTLWVYESAIIGNQSNRAGGIRNSGNMNLRNVTVSGNSVLSQDAGVGGISQNGFAVLINVTVTNNTGSGDNPASFRGGGIQTSAGEITVVKNSIIADNDGNGGPDDCVGSLTGDSKYNLIGSTEACTIPSFVSTYILNQPANLNGLALNGGTTLSHMTNSSSLARDSAYQFPPPAIDACEAYDQRGVLRPQGAGTCDMGAVEYTPAGHFITGFMLVDATSFSDIEPVLHGDILDLSQLPAEISLRAIISSTPSSVVFDFDEVDAYQIEHVAPYALDGDSGGSYSPTDFSVGVHSVRATPFTAENGTGSAGVGRSISFNVIQ